MCLIQRPEELKNVGICLPQETMEECAFWVKSKHWRVTPLAVAVKTNMGETCCIANGADKK